MPRIYPSLAERFENGYIPEPNSGCWLWIKNTYKDGYGAIVPTGARGQVGAHRVAWQLYRGPIPAGFLVCHKCDNPPCVNPEHLFLGTPSDNMVDSANKGRRASGPRCGARWRFTLNAEKVRAIRSELAVSGRGAGKALAEKYGVCRATITGIKKGKTWAWVEAA